MNRINVVSTNGETAQILALEAGRMGFAPTVSAVPETNFPAYVQDYDTCRQLPPSADTPLILLTREDPPPEAASRATAVLRQPLALDELRMALTRLSVAPSPTQPLPERTEAKRFRRSTTSLRVSVDHEKKTVTVARGTPVRLSDTEFALFLLLYENQNRPVTFAQAAAVLGEDNPNKYNVYVCYLRRKLETGHLRFIRTVRGQGYALQLTGKDDPQ